VCDTDEFFEHIPLLGGVADLLTDLRRAV